MWMMLLVCVSLDCSGATFTKDYPLLIITDTERECYQVGGDKAAVFRYWMNYEFAFKCAPVSTGPGRSDPPMLSSPG